MRASSIFFAFCLLAHSAGAAQLKAGNTTVAVNKGGCGFIDSIQFGGREVVRAGAGFVGASVALAPAGDGSIESLFTNEASVVLAAAIDEVRAEGSAISVKGTYTDGKLRVPFTRQMNLAKDAIAVEEEAHFGALDPQVVVASYSLDLPLVLDKDPHLRMFAFGGAHRAELFRMDMNDINRGGKQLISAPRGHWPYWDVAGVLQLAGSYRIWKANHADTMAYPVEEGIGAPGWADYSEFDWGITATADKPRRAAPWAIQIDARRGVFSLAPHHGSQMPVSGKSLGKRTFAFRLVLHETSWPATYPCELDFRLYEALLKDMSTGRDRPAPWVLYGPVGTADIPTIIHRERIQPSTLLRTLYRGDAWQMQGRMRTIGKATPRNQPMEKWELDARQYLDHIRKNGLPPR